MTARLHVVTDRCNRQRHKSLTNPSSLKLLRHTITAGLQNTVAAEWPHQVFGDYDAAWLPSMGPSPEARLNYIIAITSTYLARIGGGAWECHLDNAHFPRALLLRWGDHLDVVPLCVEGRIARVGHLPLSLSKTGVGRRLVQLIAVRVGAWFGHAGPLH